MSVSREEELRMSLGLDRPLRKNGSINRRVTIASLVVAATLLMAGCATSSPTSSPTVIHLDKAKVSAIQGLPVPVQAVVSIERPNNSVGYVLANTRLSSVDSWYEKRLPTGEDWKDWTWVSPTGPGCLNLFHARAVTRTWERGKQLLMLETTSSPSGTGIVVEVLPKPTSGTPIC